MLVIKSRAKALDLITNTNLPARTVSNYYLYYCNLEILMLNTYCYIHNAECWSKRINRILLAGSLSRWFLKTSEGAVLSKDCEVKIKWHFVFFFPYSESIYSTVGTSWTPKLGNVRWLILLVLRVSSEWRNVFRFRKL